MRAKQTTSCTYWISAAHPALEIQMAVGVEVPGEPGVDVSTTLLFEPELPERLADVVHQKLYDGVHAGIAAVGMPFPNGGFAVEILALQLLPDPMVIVADDEIQRIAELLGAMVMGMVAGLWGGLEALSGAPAQRTDT